MAKSTEVLSNGMIEIRIDSEVYERMSDAELDKLADTIEDQLSAGLEAVGINVCAKVGDGKLTYKVVD